MPVILRKVDMNRKQLFYFIGESYGMMDGEAIDEASAYPEEELKLI